MMLFFHPMKHLNHVHTILTHLQTHHHTFNWVNCSFNQAAVEWVGHEISVGSIAPVDTTIGQVQGIGTPQCKSDIKSFLGHVGYIQDMIPHFAQLAQPLTDLLQKASVNKHSMISKMLYYTLFHYFLSIHCPYWGPY